MPRFRGWCLAYIDAGFCYWHDQGEGQEITPGSAVIVSSEAHGLLRASQLNEVEITFYCVDAEKLSGVLSLSEQHFLRQTAQHKKRSVRIHLAGTPRASDFSQLRAASSALDSSQRLNLVRLFMDSIDWQAALDPAPSSPWKDGRERFRSVINNIPASEFVELSMAELAPMMSCSPRHLNRLFRTELGTSFREKQIELRLARACELLANSDAKVVEVALESGYQSSSVFSELFKRHFGVSPGQWRRQNAGSRTIRE